MIAFLVRFSYVAGVAFWQLVALRFISSRRKHRNVARNIFMAPVKVLFLPFVFFSFKVGDLIGFIPAMCNK